MRTAVAVGAFTNHTRLLTRQEYALIVAGGKGTRFRSSTPKQFLELKGKPVLLHTIEAFIRYSDDINIILVLPGEDIATWEALAHQYGFTRPTTIRAGGRTRFQSVKNGLDAVPDEALVAIHDGVRPLVSPQIIANSYRLADIRQSAVAVVPLKESLRVISDPDSPRPNEKNQAVDRSLYRIVQTPQTFQASVIKRAYSVNEEEALTDDASVAEKAGLSIFMFEGHYSNIKITTPEDLAVAEALLSSASRL